MKVTHEPKAPSSTAVTAVIAVLQSDITLSKPHGGLDSDTSDCSTAANNSQAANNPIKHPAAHPPTYPPFSDPLLTHPQGIDTPALCCSSTPDCCSNMVMSKVKVYRRGKCSLKNTTFLPTHPATRPTHLAMSCRLPAAGVRRHPRSSAQHPPSGTHAAASQSDSDAACYC